MARASYRAARTSRLAFLAAPRPTTISRFAALVTVAVVVVRAVSCDIELEDRQLSLGTRVHTIIDMMLVVVVSGVLVVVVESVTVALVAL